jgi:hypothetical protein
MTWWLVAAGVSLVLVGLWPTTDLLQVTLHGILGVGSVAAARRGFNGISLGLLLASGLVALLSSPSAPLFAFVGYMLWGIGGASAVGRRGLPLSSWLAFLGLLVAGTATWSWIPLRDNLLRSGSWTPLIVALGALGLVAIAVAIVPSRDDGASVTLPVPDAPAAPLEK